MYHEYMGEQQIIRAAFEARIRMSLRMERAANTHSHLCRHAYVQYQSSNGPIRRLILYIRPPAKVAVRVFCLLMKIYIVNSKNSKSGYVGWLVGCFGFNGPLRQYFSLYRAVSQREGERGERIDESKNVQTTPPAPTASAIGPCPTVIKIVGRPGTGSLPSTIAPPDHPIWLRRRTI